MVSLFFLVPHAPPASSVAACLAPTRNAKPPGSVLDLSVNKGRRDLKTLEADSKTLRPSRRYTHHTQIVNDVQHHPISKSFIGSVSDDQTLQIVDVRQSETAKAAVVAREGHLDAINALAFNPTAEVLVATASADKTVGIWDLRNIREKVHTLDGHNDAVTSLAWHPTEASILGSGSYDRRIIFWDLSRVGEEQLPDDQEDGPPEL